MRLKSAALTTRHERDILAKHPWYETMIVQCIGDLEKCGHGMRAVAKKVAGYKLFCSHDTITLKMNGFVVFLRHLSFE